LRDYTILRSKRKTLAIIINSSGEIIVKAPMKTPVDEIENIINKKKKWIEEKQALIENKKNLYKVHNFEEGEEFLILGKKIYLTYADSRKNTVLHDNRLCISKFITDKKTSVLKWYKKTAFIILKERINKYEAITGLKVKSVKITSAKRRWGSCTQEGNINFSFRLIMCPIEVVDYVVLHEIIHLIYPNHSKDFYNCIKLFMPEYKNHKKWLCDNQRIMDII